MPQNARKRLSDISRLRLKLQLPANGLRDLGDGWYLLLTQVGDGTDPQEWAETCRILANCHPAAFSALVAEISRHRDEL